MDFFVPAMPNEEGVAAPALTERGDAGAEKDKFSEAFMSELSIIISSK